jgi:hypothetical protein
VNVSDGAVWGIRLSEELKILKSVSKPKLRKELSYVLKTMQLEAALIDANVSLHVDLIYWEHWQKMTGHSILQALFWISDERIGYDRIFVRAGCVPAQERSEAVDALASQGLPQFIAWVRTLNALPMNSPVRQQRPIFDATWREDGLNLHHAP